MHPKRAALPYIEALDGLRGLAVLGILLFHAGHLDGGWLGVDLFFVLSGFLITSLLLLEYEATERVSFRDFWGRRARRLLPALLMTLLGVCLYAQIFARPEELARIRADVIATLFYVANWHSILAGHDYWEIFRAPSPLDHTWSLAIEEQFYLLWPPTFLLLMRRARGSEKFLTLSALGLALLSALWMAACYDPEQGSARVYYGTDTRLSAMFIGIAIASSLRAKVRRTSQDAEPQNGAGHAGDALAWLGLSIVIFAATAIDGNDPFVYRGGLFGLGLASGAVIVGILISPGGYAARSLSLPPLKLLGIISYGVYLWHWPLYLVLSPDRTGWTGWPLTTLRIAVTLGLATISYLALERPIRRGKLSPGRSVGAAIAFSVAVLACSWFATETGPQTLHQATAPQFEPEIESNLDVLLIGDSVAFELQSEFMNEAHRRNQNAYVMAIEGCGSLRSDAMRFLNGQIFSLAPCLKLRKHWLKQVVRSKPKIVILLEGWSGEGEKKISGNWTHPCRRDFDSAFSKDLALLLRSFEAAGALTIVVAMPPPIPRDLSAQYAGQWGGRENRELGDLFRKRMVCLNQVRRQVVDETRSLLVDLDARVCPDGRCRSEFSNFAWRPDGMHFSGPSATWVSSWLWDRAQALLSRESASAGHEKLP